MDFIAVCNSIATTTSYSSTIIRGVLSLFNLD